MASQHDSMFLEDDLTCCVCAEVFEDPVMLFCGHDLCRKCCEALYRQSLTKKHNTGKFYCPECRADVALEQERGVDSLPRNFRLQNLCDRVKQMKIINPVECLPGLNDDPYSTLSVSYMRRKGSVMSHMATLVEKIKEMERFIKTLDEKCETVEKNCGKLKVSISKECEALYQILDQKRKSMLHDIDKHKHDITTQLRRQIAVYSKALEEAKQAEMKTTSDMESMRKKDFIKNTKSLEDRLDNASTSLPGLTPAVSDKFVISVDFKAAKDDLQKLRIDVRDKLRSEEQEDNLKKLETGENSQKSMSSDLLAQKQKDSGKSGNRKNKKHNDPFKKRRSTSDSDARSTTPPEPSSSMQFETAT
ncbi:tripartite motif-containing protein 55-like [Saccoglossus kowalevskii]|uniref:E3 ubiquitin-protein ligase TRIM63-like n=1 Tax=Saccoglossus kowalevskii TaxID=10224 RepID=A0A0U2L5Y5_SACKO|nr:PREDICTED: E3 ubiquitin-protein ligase TRIM63-like [Saccoglossus kowalevskii]ALR88665.1 midline protein-like 145 [Saccoglossus kowalevskii]